MLDILLLRKDLDTAIARLETRKTPQTFLDVSVFQALEAERKTLQTRTEELQAQRNQLSKQIGMLMGKGDKGGAEAAKAQVAASKTELEQSAARLEQIQAGALMATGRAPLPLSLKTTSMSAHRWAWTLTWESSCRARASRS